MDANGNTADEEWADMYANFVSGNLDLSKEAGKIRLDFVKSILQLVPKVSISD